MTVKTTQNLKSWLTTIHIAVGATVIISLIALALLWPMHTAKPHDIPVAIIGDHKITNMLKGNLEKKSGNTFDITLVDTKDQAVDQIKSRHIVGAINANPVSPEVLTASANGQNVNALISGIAPMLQAQINMAKPQGAQSKLVQVQDIVPTHKANFDIGVLILPLMLGSIVGAVLSAIVITSRLQRIVMLFLYSILAATTLYAIFHIWFNAVPNNFIGIAGVCAVIIFATTTFISGLYSLFGAKGLVLGAAFTMLVGNPISGFMVPALFLPGSWEAIGQLLTPGAGVTLLRSVSYFTDSIAMPLIVLAGWAVVGVVCIAAKSRDALKG